MKMTIEIKKQPFQFPIRQKTKFVEGKMPYPQSICHKNSNWNRKFVLLLSHKAQN